MSKIIHAISGPRNISTAVMYSFAQRPGCAVFDEPMYGKFLQTNGLNHPGRDETQSKWPTDLTDIADAVQKLATKNDEVYLKNMAHHMVNEPWDWAEQSAFIFWIRHPRKVVQSFAKVIPDVTSEDIGLVQQWQQWQEIQHFPGAKIIIDSDEMLADPAATLPRICAALGLPWHAEMLSWPAGSKSYDGPWAKHWYTNVHESTGFGPPKALPEALTPELEKVVEAALPAYLSLFTNRFKI
ncbi:sulfotransferase [Schleiferiaceae bacterium]|nr:sulfotransferase [Schleiferiaceae bacterium]